MLLSSGQTLTGCKNAADQGTAMHPFCVAVRGRIGVMYGFSETGDSRRRRG
jgi:hypothetical protein